MLVTLRLVVLEFPQPPKNSDQFLLGGHRERVGRGLGLFLRHATEGIKERMKLVVKVVKGLVLSLAALGRLGTGVQHRGEVEHRLDPGGALGLLPVFTRAWVKQITAAT